MSLAELKRRVVKGTKLTMVRHDWFATGGLVVNGNTGTTTLKPKVQLGLAREVSVATSTKIALLTPDDKGGFKESWMHWPKANCVRETANGFQVDLSGMGTFKEVMEYEFAHNQELAR